MKVLMLGWELPPDNSGGLGVACLQLSKALADAGADIEFVLPYYHSQKYSFMNVASAFKNGVKPTSVFGAYESYRYDFSETGYIDFETHNQQAAYSKKVSQIVEQLEFDVIHA